MNEVVEMAPGLAVGEKLTVKIHDLAFGGEGIARVHDFVVLVPFVLPHEEVEVEITELKKRFGRARLLRILQASSQRVTPLCPYFTDCGGCQYQHAEYSLQLEIKRKQVADLFERVGGFQPTVVQPVVPCPKPYGYRNRIMIRSQWDKYKQGLNIGFVRADNRLVVDIDHCEIAEPRLNDQIREVRHHPPPKGGIKVVLRVLPDNWEVPPDSFFQNNFFLLPQLVEVVREMLGAAKSRFLIDVYCGVGFFAIATADMVEKFIGVELDRLAIKAARRNALLHGRENGDFVDGRAEQLLPGLLARYSAVETTVIVDPPRTGCPPEMLEILRQNCPTQIIYVSCHPATLARDLNILCQSGVFQLQTVVPLDMFPQTQHVECVADIRSKQHFVQPI